MVKSKARIHRSWYLVAGEFAALGAAAVILLVFLASSLDGLLVRNGLGAAVITADLIGLANTDRESNNVPALSVSPTLVAIAQAKANDMAAKSYFAHTSPDGHDPWYWFQLGGYAFTYAGENLAVDFSDSADVERAWMASPTHRANLLDPHYTQIGIATAVGTYQGHTATFVVQEFGTPSTVVASASTNAPTEIIASTAPENPTVLAEAISKPAPAPRPAKVLATTHTPAASAPTVASTSPEKSAIVAIAAAPALSSPKEPEGVLAIWNIFASSPKTTLRYAYYLFGFLILLALLIETGVEWKHHHTRHVALAVALIALMGGLFLAADRFVFTTPVVGEAGAVAPPSA